MRQFKTFFIAMFLSMGTIGVAQAQAEESQTAHIASQKLIEMMPGFQSAMTELQQLQDTYTASLEDMYKEAQALAQQYDAEAPTKTQEENQARALEMQKMKQKIMEYEQSIRKKLRKKKQDLLMPVYEKARKAIQKVARAKGYEYVLDSTTGTGVLLADGYNLMPAVKEELGIQ